MLCCGLGDRSWIYVNFFLLTFQTLFVGLVARARSDNTTIEAISEPNKRLTQAITELDVVLF